MFVRKTKNDFFAFRRYIRMSENGFSEKIFLYERRATLIIFELV